MWEQMNTLGARIRLAITVAALVLFIIFLLQNTDTIPVKLLFFDADIPVAVLVMVVALGGFALGYYMAFIGGRRRHKHQVLRQQAKEARQQAKAAPSEAEDKE